jgi:hypothetical protein
MTAPATGAAAEPGPTTPVVLGLLLATLVVSLQLPAALRVPDPWQWPALPLQLVLPGLFHADDAPRLPLLVDERPPREVHLPLATLRDVVLDEQAVSRDSVTPGCLPLLLALLGLCAARGRLALAGRGLLLAGIGLPVAAAWLPVGLDDPGRLGTALGLIGLALLAGAGLARLGPRAPDGRDEGPALVLGALAVALTALLVGLSLRAGAVSDERVVQPLLDRLDAARPRDDLLLHDPAIVAANAAWLRAVLDRAALASFAGLCALLLHLRSRGPLTGALLLAAVAADLLSVRLLL